MAKGILIITVDGESHPFGDFHDHEHHEHLVWKGREFDPDDEIDRKQFNENLQYIMRQWREEFPDDPRTPMGLIVTKRFPNLELARQKLKEQEEAEKAEALRISQADKAAADRAKTGPQKPVSSRPAKKKAAKKKTTKKKVVITPDGQPRTTKRSSA